jgi:hypothetical protein
MGMTPEEKQFAREEFERIFISDQEVRALCERNSRQFLPDGPAAAPLICDQIGDAVRTRTPLSLLRVGNGEGNVVSMTKAERHPLMVSTFYSAFVSHNGIAVPEEQAIALCEEVRTALTSADIIGFRSFATDERTIISRCIEEDWAYAATGILYARELLQQGMAQAWWSRSVVTSAWIHLDLIPHVEKMLKAADAIIVVTGREKLRGEMESRLGDRLEEFICVPVQGSRPSTVEESHIFSAFPAVRARLSRDLAGKLVLVGAGFFGKVYCHIARSHGAVAVDFGSAFDILAGLSTRPVHADYDVAALRWL